jgi:hypothetical protein
MKLLTALSICVAGTMLFLSGCGDGGSTVTAPAPSGNATFNLVVADTPPSNIAVMSFQVQIASAVLQPGNVSVLPRPVTVDLAQLVTDTGFLASTIIGSGNYTSLTVTLANPQVTLMNNTTAALNLNGQSCAVGAVCTYVPALNNASVTVSSGVFPLTISANSTTGMNLDLSIPDLLQSDLSVTLANGKSLNLSLLPTPATSSAQQAELDDVLGTVTAISGSQVTITTSFGDSLILTSNSATKYKFPSSVCSAPNNSCLAVGQVVAVDLSLLGNGGLTLNTLSYAGPNGSQVAKGIILSTTTTTAIPTAQVLLQRSINLSSLTPGQIVTVALPTTIPYFTGTASYPGVSSATFTSYLDLLPGQEVLFDVGSALNGGTSPSFTASAAYLEASQVIGQIGTVNTGSSSLTVNALSGLFTASRPVIQQIGVQTDATTSYTGFTASSFSALANGQFLAAKGPLFNTVGANGSPTLSAIQLRARTVGN